jgi:hypothetical protein
MESSGETLNRLSFPGVAARETAQALKTLAQAARGVAASTNDPEAAHAMLDSARDVMEGSAMLIQEAKQALIAPGDTESQQRLAQVSPGTGNHGYQGCIHISYLLCGHVFLAGMPRTQQVFADLSKVCVVARLTDHTWYSVFCLTYYFPH